MLSAPAFAPAARPINSNTMKPAAALTVPRNTKLVCTVGPACASHESLTSVIAAGANVLRLNFSHSEHAWHSSMLGLIRQIGEELGRPLSIMQDLCGPKIRLSRVAREGYQVQIGDQVRVTTESYLRETTGGVDPAMLNCDLASNYPALLDDVGVGHRLLINDGQMELEVLEKQAGVLVTRALRAGPISKGKGLNLPGIPLSTPSLTKKDWADLEWGIANRVDYIALSFVRKPSDLVAVRQRLDDAGSAARLIAKIERPEAIQCLPELLELADGLMVARGDLGLETDLARVPILQKQMIAACRRAGKPVITATQMLESMILAPTPTRAEVSDVANAIFDGSDAIMLSGETASGQFPVEAVRVLNRVALVTEAEINLHAPERLELAAVTDANLALLEAMVGNAADAARRLGAKAVVVYSQSGLTARLMARYRLPMPIVAVTSSEATWRQLSLSYGVHPLYLPHDIVVPQLLEAVDQYAVEKSLARQNDLLLVLIALDGGDGCVDTLHVHRVGN